MDAETVCLKLFVFLESRPLSGKRQARRNDNCQVFSSALAEFFFSTLTPGGSGVFNSENGHCLKGLGSM